MSARPPKKLDRWTAWLRTHGINFPSLPEAERLRVRALYAQETKGIRAQPRSAQGPSPAPATVGGPSPLPPISPLPEHLTALGAGQPSPEPGVLPPPPVEVRIAPSTIWATMWDLVYRARAALQYYPMVRDYVPFPEVERIWNLADFQSAQLGDATATAWQKYVPATHPANIALQQIWPALMLASAIIIVEKQKQDEWSGLIRILQQGPAVPPQYQPPQQPVEPMQPQPTSASAAAMPWEAFAPNGHAPAPEEMDQPTVSLRQQLEAAGAQLDDAPPPGMGLRQAMTKYLGPQGG